MFHCEPNSLRTYILVQTKYCSVLADCKVTRAQISDWMKQEDDSAFEKLSDKLLATYLNGLINDKRGKKDGPQPVPEKNLTNNAVFMKLKIALNLKAEDVLAMMALAGMRISKHELSAFFRKPNNKHYRGCKDQILRKFLKGLQLRYRPGPSRCLLHKESLHHHRRDFFP